MNYSFPHLNHHFILMFQNTSLTQKIITDMKRCFHYCDFRVIEYYHYLDLSFLHENYYLPSKVKQDEIGTCSLVIPSLSDFGANIHY